MLKRLLVVLLLISGWQIATASVGELDSLKRIVESMPNGAAKCASYLRIAILLYAGEESEVYADKALSIAKELQDQRLIGKAYHRLAWCHGLDEMTKKTAFLDSAAARFRNIDDLYGLGNVFDTKGTILMNYGSLSEAVLAYQSAYDFFSSIENEERKAGVLNNWAICDLALGNVDEAMRKFQNALEFRRIEQPRSHIETARLYQGLGECYRRSGDIILAATNYLNAYEERKLVNNIGAVESMLSLADLIFETTARNADTTAISDLINQKGMESSSQLIQMAERFRGVDDRIDIQLAIMDVKRKRHVVHREFEEAYQLLLTQKQLEDEYKLSEGSLDALADMKLRFEKDQLKIRLLEEEVLNQKTKDRITMLLFALGGLLLLVVIGFLYYQNRVKSTQLQLTEMRNEQQILSMRSMLEGQEKERSRIARDLHDGLGNLLSTLKVNIGSLQINFDDSNSRKLYGSASQMIDDACTEVRKIAHEMMPQALKKLGLRKALEDLVAKMAGTHTFDIDFQVHGNEQTFDDNTNVMLYRMVQEALNNIVKYAEAKEVSVQMTYSEEWFDLVIEDDGIGFDPAAPATQRGMGLKSIAFRTEFIGGGYDINSRPGHGTLITINMPLSNETKD